MLYDGAIFPNLLIYGGGLGVGDMWWGVLPYTPTMTLIQLIGDYVSKGIDFVWDLLDLGELEDEAKGFWLRGKDENGNFAMWITEEQLWTNGESRYLAIIGVKE